MTVKVIKLAPTSKPDLMLAIKQHPEYPQLHQDGYKYEAANEYADQVGNPLFYKVRLKHPVSKDKWIRSIHFNGSEWIWKEPHFDNGLKPLYNLQALAANPDDTIWICEGEWAADNLNKFFKEQKIDGENIATTSGSATSASKVDWSVSVQRHHLTIFNALNYPQTFFERITNGITDISA